MILFNHVAIRLSHKETFITHYYAAYHKSQDCEGSMVDLEWRITYITSSNTNFQNTFMLNSNLSGNSNLLLIVLRKDKNINIFTKNKYEVFDK